MASTSGDFKRGSMPIVEQKETWRSFMQVTWWTSILVAMVILQITLHFAVGLDWWTSLGASAVLGIAGGLLLNLGAAWIATTIGVVIMGAVVGVLLTLAGG